jgi:hypothetical protein
MARAHNESSSLRFGRRESERVIAALLISVLVHLAVGGGYYAGKKLGVWQRLHLTGRQPAAKKYELQAQISHANQQDPTIFVDVSHADAEAPVKTKYYSNRNSRAANLDEANENVPKITGSQTEVPKTEDVPKLAKKAADSPPASPKDTAKEPPKADHAPQLTKLEPSMPPPSPLPPEVPEAPKTPGDLDARPPKTEPQPERPRTLRQALAQRDQLPGQQMQQAGGVRRRELWPSLDVKSTAFGDYDRDLIMAVSQRWDDLLDNHRYAQDRQGKVVLQFKLKPDGAVIEMQTLENSVGEVLGYLCQESVEEAAPFAKWPPDMVRMIGANYREITFTFYYY